MSTTEPSDKPDRPRDEGDTRPDTQQDGSVSEQEIVEATTTPTGDPDVRLDQQGNPVADPHLERSSDDQPDTSVMEAQRERAASIEKHGGKP